MHAGSLSHRIFTARRWLIWAFFSFCCISSKYFWTVSCLQSLPPQESSCPPSYRPGQGLQGLVPLLALCAVTEHDTVLYRVVVRTGLCLDALQTSIVFALGTQHSQPQERLPTSGFMAWFFLLPPCTQIVWMQGDGGNLSAGSRAPQLIFLLLEVGLSLAPSCGACASCPERCHGSVPPEKSQNSCN